jgi:hypothetical protein
MMAASTLRRRALTLATAMLVVQLAIPGVAQAESLTLTGQASYMRNGLFAGSTVVQVQNQGPDFEERGIIEFDLSSITRSVTSATLLLDRSSPVNPPFDLEIYSYGDNASEWDAGSLYLTITYSGESSLSLDVTSAVQALQAANMQTAGFNLRKPTYGSEFVNFNNNPSDQSLRLPSLNLEVSNAVGPPKSRGECENDGWQKFDTPRKFKNQGDCVRFVTTG